VRNASDEPFPSAVAALENLAHCMAIKWVEDSDMSRNSPRPCCVEFQRRAEPGDRSCPKCGRILAQQPLDLEAFEDFVHGHHTGQMAMGYGEALSEFGPWDEFVGVSDILDVPGEQILVLAPYGERLVTLALRGDEFDDPDHRCHGVAEALKEGVEDYWAGHGWVEDDPDDREAYAKILEGYRAKKP
jgi:hypothetical protein